MALVGWTAFGTLSTKVITQAGSGPEILAYGALVIAVCATCAALIALAEIERTTREVLADDRGNDPEADALRSAAAQMCFPENRLRLLTMAERLEAGRTARSPPSAVPSA
jgi:hypothetical protein